LNETAASAAKLGKCILFHAYLRTTALAPSCASTTKNSYNLFK